MYNKSTEVSLLRQIAANPWREAADNNDNGDNLRFYLVSLGSVISSGVKPGNMYNSTLLQGPTIIRSYV